MNLETGSIFGREWHHTNCYGCGLDNPKGLQADFTFDEATGEVRFSYQPKLFQEGAPGYSHGGITAAMLDEAQGSLCFHLGHVVMTEKLRLNYHKAVPLDRPYHVRAWLTTVRKRRLYTRGVIYNDNEEVYISSSASWYALPDRLMRKMFAGRYDEEESEKVSKAIEVNRKRAREIRKRIREQSQK